MCFELDSEPPIPRIYGAAVSHDDLTLASVDGNQFAAFRAVPEGGLGAGVVILPDVRGLYRFYEELALRFAERGIAAIAFDYFGRTACVGKRLDDWDYMPLVQQLTPAEVMEDVGTCLRDLIALDRLERGSLAANTVVVRIPRVAEPDIDQLSPGKFNSLRQHPHLAARLRQRVSPGEAAVAVQALIRREEFDPVERVGLFAELAAHFREKVEFPAEATDGIADEQFLRNIVDVLVVLVLTGALAVLRRLLRAVQKDVAETKAIVLASLPPKPREDDTPRDLPPRV